jgi:sulfhydrogenase subunit beta (sulfur reductase)
VQLCITIEGLSSLLTALQQDGFLLLGPRLKDGAIIYDEITGIDSLPVGWTETQEPGSYQLSQTKSGALFGYASTAQSWKKFFFAPTETLWKIRKEANGLRLLPEVPSLQKKALLGVRSCDLHAMKIQEQVFLKGPHADEHYAQRQRDTFIVAVQCGQAASTCFCTSMSTGPRASAGFDLALTELFEGGHRFLVEVGSDAGDAYVKKINPQQASEADQRESLAATARASSQMKRSVDTTQLKETLYQNLEHPRWDHVAARCLACANCTMVCPTCFCSTTEDTTSLDGQEATRQRRWDSCFTMDHSYIHGGSVRVTHKSRYRQWLVHKFASWIDQFGSSGCVGCGRCISWCPAKIDVTEELAQIRKETP